MGGSRSFRFFFGASSSFSTTAAALTLSTGLDLSGLFFVFETVVGMGSGSAALRFLAVAVGFLSIFVVATQSKPRAHFALFARRYADGQVQ